MGITRAQIARQLLAEGGMPMKKIKGQDHMLAYITPNEANKLVRLGGQETMTPEGIPAYPEYDNYGYSNQQDFDAGDRSKSNDPNVSGGDRNRTTARELAAINALEAIGYSPKKTFKDKIIDSLKSVGRFSPTVNTIKGIGSFFGGMLDKFQNLRGFNPDGTRRTQAQFERARDIRRAEKSIANIMGRKTPFTDLTLDRLADLYSVLGQNVPGNINESLIGTTNITRSATPDDVFPDRAEGIVTQAPTTFRDAMANLNLERGVPRDQVFLSAKDFINPDIAQGPSAMQNYFNVPIEERMATSAGVPGSAIQLTKNYTKEDMEKLGAEDRTILGANDQLDALQDYYDFAQKQFGMGKDPSAIRNSAKIGSSLYGLNLDLVPKDFLETEQDFKQQKSPFELFGK
tara:strand:- start:33 stop:1238 length:1206 start_codon:yes stop_codon:yes gene_type:complete